MYESEEEGEILNNPASEVEEIQPTNAENCSTSFQRDRNFQGQTPQDGFHSRWQGERGTRPSSERHTSQYDHLNVDTPQISPQQSSTQEFVKTMMDSQVRTLQDFLETLVERLPLRDNTTRLLTLPEFDPENRGSDPRAWLTTADYCIRENPRSGSQLILTLSRSLKGSASRWLSQISYPDITWEDFKILFTSEFDIVGTPASIMASQLNSSPKDNESYVAFATKMLSVLNARCNNMKPQEIFISMTLAHLSKFDERIRHIAYTGNVSNRETLLKELQALPYGGKRHANSSYNSPEAKRQRFSEKIDEAASTSSRITCNYCKRSGHRISECRTRQRAQSSSRPSISSSRTSGTSVQDKRLACYTCGSTEHLANRCDKRGSRSQQDRKAAEKKVGLCAVNPTGELFHKGEKFEYSFDSGSECSLLRHTISSKFHGPIFEQPVMLSGIGSSRVTSNSQIVSDVFINDNELTIYFHIVPDDSITSNVIIGREVLAKGVKVLVSSKTCSFIPDEDAVKVSNQENRLRQGRAILSNVSLEEGGGLEGHSTNVLPSSPSPFKEPPTFPGTDISNVPTEIPDIPCCVRTVDKSIESISRYFDSPKHTVSNVSRPFTLENITTDLNGDRKYELISILQKYERFFSDGFPKTTVTTGEMKIRLHDPNKIVHRRPYPLSPADKQVVREHIAELEAAGIIRPSTSAFSSPILLVPKKNGKLRMVTDFRALNSNTIPESHPMPLIKDQIARLTGANYLSLLDLVSGFYQIPIAEDSIEYTAFVTPDGHYEYLKMAMGLKNSPSCFTRAVLKALGPLAHTHVAAFMDDLMIFASTIDEALTRLDETLHALTSAGFVLNPEKCSFLVTKVLYLGFEVSQGEIRPNSKKVEVLLNLEPPKTVAALRSFIGLASYFRQFIKDFSLIAAPLYRLLSSKGTLKWLPEHEEARQKLITCLTSEPVLAIFDPEKPTELHCDASSLGFGAILIQLYDKKPRVVGYFSKRTTVNESQYHSYELETISLVKAIRHFHSYLQYHPFTAITDCKSLKESYFKQELHTRVHRWWAYLQSFDFKIKFRDAKRMQHADFMSRYPLSKDLSGPPAPSPVPSYRQVESNAPLQLSISKPQRSTQIIRVDLTTLPDDWLLISQRQDPEIVSLISKIENDELPEDIKSTYEIRSGVLCRIIQRNFRSRCLPIVPHAYKWSIVNNVHESLMHLGWEKTLEKLCDYYWFEHMNRYVRKFVDNCLTCKLSKTTSGKTQIAMHPIPKTAVPWHTIHIDISGKLSGRSDSKEYVIVIICAFTKFVLLTHTRKLDTANVIKALKRAVSLFGSPSRIIADQGRCFVSSEFKQFCSQHQVELHLIATGAARANGQVERVMSVLTNMFTAVEVDAHSSWQSALDDIQLAINSTINRVTRSSPLELMIAKVAKPVNLIAPNESIVGPVNVNIDEVRDRAAQHMIKDAEYNKTRFDKTKAKVKLYSLGDLVLIANEPRCQTKLDPKFRGVFKIIDLLPNDRYLLQALTGNRTYKFPHDRVRPIPSTEMLPELSDVDGPSDDDRSD